MQTSDWKLKIKSQNIKIIKRNGPENLNNPKFMAPKPIIDHKTNESKLHWD